MNAAATFERRVLEYDPFNGDMEDARTLKDKIVTARKKADCNICAGEIQPGDRVRSITEVCEGAIQTNRFCPECCEAMAARDDDESIDKRHALGYKRRTTRSQP